VPLFRCRLVGLDPLSLLADFIVDFAGLLCGFLPLCRDAFIPFIGCGFFASVEISPNGIFMGDRDEPSADEEPCAGAEQGEDTERNQDADRGAEALGDGHTGKCPSRLRLRQSPRARLSGVRRARLQPKLQPKGRTNPHYSAFSIAVRRSEKSAFHPVSAALFALFQNDTAALGNRRSIH
jgi:hypothetical protein